LLLSTATVLAASTVALAAEQPGRLAGPPGATELREVAAGRPGEWGASDPAKHLWFWERFGTPGRRDGDYGRKTPAGPETGKGKGVGGPESGGRGSLGSLGGGSSGTAGGNGNGGKSVGGLGSLGDRDSLGKGNGNGNGNGNIGNNNGNNNQGNFNGNDNFGSNNGNNNLDSFNGNGNVGNGRGNGKRG
jgi:hypothetical protein